MVWDALISFAFALVCLILAGIAYSRWDQIAKANEDIRTRWSATPLRYLGLGLNPGGWGWGPVAKAGTVVMCIAFALMFLTFAIAALLG